jgi:ribosomal protein S18 acetylase RimI-like enzyme
MSTDPPSLTAGSVGDVLLEHVVDGSPELVEELHPLIAEMVREGAALGWIEVPSRSEVGELFADLVLASEHDDAALIVLRRRGSSESAGEALGFAYWTRRELETERPHADVGRIAISSRARGGGLGRRLVEELVSTAEAAGIEVLTLDVRGNNHAAMALYERVGFVEYGRLADYIAIEDERWDNVYYALDLRNSDHGGLVRHGDAPQGPGSSHRKP